MPPTLLRSQPQTGIAVQASANIDRRFMSFLSDLLLCSRCLRHGFRTPIVQAISSRHRPRTLCRDCERHRLRAAIDLHS
jgi:superfamily II helicase